MSDADASAPAVTSAEPELRRADRREPSPAPSAGSPPQGHGDSGERDPVEDLRPRDIVSRLDEYIIGQQAAKRAVAIALRNRFRRRRLSEELREDVVPRNILMIGPTGVGKTELARRLARIGHAPFAKGEATRFTEVGYVGRDAESIIRDLLEQTISELHGERTAAVEDRARELAEERITDALLAEEERASAPAAAGDTDRGDRRLTADPPGAANAAEKGRRRRLRRRQLLRRVSDRRLDDRMVDIEVEESFQPPVDTFSGTAMEDVGVSLGDFFAQLSPPRKRMRRMTVAEARRLLLQEETDKLLDTDRLYDDAIDAVEEAGIVFLDEVDKICGHVSDHGPDVSGEGVQRDLLGILEGTTVHTRYGAVRTDHILFIGAGAFTAAKPSDLIPEFQGRFPIRVELQPLSVADLERILVEPSNALTRQYAALLATEGVTLVFRADAVHELAVVAAAVNGDDENIGARRLFTLMERLLEDLSYAAEDHSGTTITIDAPMVRERLGSLAADQDLRRYIL